MKAWTARVVFVSLTAVMVWLVGSRHSELLSQPPIKPTQAASQAGDIQVISTVLPTGIQQLAVIDPSDRTMAIYHIEPTQGKIQLRSVRNLVWDLRMEEFNGLSPLPSELRQVEP